MENLFSQYTTTFCCSLTILPFILKNICKQTILQNHTYTNCSLSRRAVICNIPCTDCNAVKLYLYHFCASLQYIQGTFLMQGYNCWDCNHPLPQMQKTLTILCGSFQREKKCDKKCAEFTKWNFMKLAILITFWCFPIMTGNIFSGALAQGVL